MSATSACRVKARNGVVSSSAAATKPSFNKPLTPIPISIGKENSSSSRPAARPKTRPDRPAGPQRWSTSSSAPRGRSQSPSETVRDRRLPAERSVSAGKCGPRVRVSDFGKERKGLGLKSGESGSEFGVRVSRVSREEIGKFDSGSDRVSKISMSGGSSRCSSTKARDFGGDESAVKEVKVLPLPVSVAKESSSQSKLHAKLAFLEGKVKRIASDIKKTKEILDQNNPDASKVILLDIQDKITGIEKAMRGSGSGSGSAKAVEGNGRSSVKGLNNEELEARLFPHRKLLRSRARDLKASVTDENPIAAEFLASLEKETEKEKPECTEVGEDDIVEKEHGDDSAEASVLRDDGVDVVLTTDERLDDFDEQEESRRGMSFEEEIEDISVNQLNEIGAKVATGGWFVSEGESVLLAHDDGSCSFHDVVNTEEKSIYKPPAGVSPNMWRDCWVIRAPSADGCAGRYVVAASAGNAMDSGFCSWDFFTKDVRAFHVENGTTVPSSRTALGALSNNISSARNSLSSLLDPSARQWWYKPCGPLIIATASSQRAVSVYDIRDGERIMKWDVPKPVVTMEFSSPLQWRNRGKVVVAETESLSLWDVNSLTPQALQSVPCGRKISALHVNNSDAELGGGVRQRLSSSEAEGNEGIFCTQDSINILDFRHPSGVGLKILKPGVNVHSVYSRGDSVFLGCTKSTSGIKRQFPSEIQQFSLRKQKLFTTYSFPESNVDLHHAAITQVWGNSNHVMGVCGLGLFVFDAMRDNEIHCFSTDHGKTQNVREIVGPDDMFSPSFDYSGCRALMISRDRPAMWRHLS